MIQYCSRWNLLCCKSSTCDAVSEDYNGKVSTQRSTSAEQDPRDHIVKDDSTEASVTIAIRARLALDSSSIRFENPVTIAIRFDSIRARFDTIQARFEHSRKNEHV